MFSSRLVDRGRGYIAGWSLRSRLIAWVMVLLATACVVIGGVTEVAMRDFLVRKVDAQLSVVSRGGPQNGDLFGPGFGPGSVRARRSAGGVFESGYIRHNELPPDPPSPAGARPGPGNGPEFSATPLPAGAVAVLAALPADGRARTRDLGSLGSYRLVARPTRGGVLVTGLPLADVNATLYRLAAVELLVTLLALGAVLVGGQFVIRRTLRPLRRVAATATRVAELPLHTGEVAVAEHVQVLDTDPRTEVGQVGAALNRLLGHVHAALTARQASEMRLRQFIADASHELRTPLAAIRGYAELGRRGGGLPVDQVLERVESQTTRMTALIEDLLLLARIDAGRPLDRSPVDLSALVVESVGDAHVAGRDHRWVLDLPEEPVEVPGDSARLHQVLANLLANARTHTAAGTTVTVGLHPGADHAEITVADDGPGIPTDLQPHVFQRFARGDGSRSRKAGSTGLGLSIVDAVVVAHGGTVTVDSHPGRTVFTVRLPAGPEGSQATHSGGTRTR